MLEFLRVNKVLVSPQRSATQNVLKCFLIRKDCTDISTRAVILFVSMGFAPFLWSQKSIFDIFHFTAYFVHELNVEFTKNMCFIEYT